LVLLVCGLFIFLSISLSLFLFYSPWLNFINVLCTAFTCIDPVSVRIQLNPQYLFTLLGSKCAKAAHKMLMKSTPSFLISIDRYPQPSLYLSGCLVTLKVKITSRKYLSGLQLGSTPKQQLVKEFAKLFFCWFTMYKHEIFSLNRTNKLTSLCAQVKALITLAIIFSMSAIQKYSNLLRPCERQNIPTFVVLQNSKHRIFQIFLIYQKYCVIIILWKYNKINHETFEAKNICFEVKNIKHSMKDLQKAEYSDFCSFVKFETRNILNILYIYKILC